MGALTVVVLAVALLGGSAALALGAIPDSQGVIHGCYGPLKGRLRVIDADAGKICTPRETALDWNQTVPPGPGSTVTTIKTTAQDVDFVSTDALFHERLTLGSFTKTVDSSLVRITWQGPVWIKGTTDGTCTFELRVDGAADDGYTGDGFGPEGGTSVLWLTNGASINEQAINDSAYFAGLPAGPHVISVWVRGTSDVPGADSCFINPGVFTMTTDIEEIATQTGGAP